MKLTACTGTPKMCTGCVPVVARHVTPRFAVIVYLLRLGGSALCQPKRMGLILGATSFMSSNLAVSPNTRFNIHLLIVYSSYAYLECLVFIVYLLDFLHRLGGLAFVSPKECV
jgi:hypothetical protein